LVCHRHFSVLSDFQQLRYASWMADLLEKALQAVRRLPHGDQERIARVMLALANDDTPEAIDPSHLEDVLEGLAQAQRGELATDAEVARAFSRFGA
jgi:hypothetical protein